MDKAAPGSAVLGLPSTPAGKEASMTRPFKGCAARKFSCSRESSGPHRESERVGSWGGQRTVGGGLITQKQKGPLPPSPTAPTRPLHLSLPPHPQCHHHTPTHLLSTQLYCLVEHSPDDPLGTGGCGERPLVSEVAAEVRGQQRRYIQSWDPSLRVCGEDVCWGPASLDLPSYTHQSSGVEGYIFKSQKPS